MDKELGNPKLESTDNMDDKGTFRSVGYYAGTSTVFKYTKKLLYEIFQQYFQS